MIQTIRNAWAVPELRKKILFTIMALLIFRLGFGIILGVHFQMGVVGVWIAMIIDWVVRISCFIPRVRKKLWLEHPPQA